MKRIITLSLILLFCLCLIACDVNETTDSGPHNESIILQNEDDKDIKDNNYQSDPELPGTIKINLSTVKYCVDAPKTASKRANTGHIVELDSYFVVYDQYIDISSDGRFGVDLNKIKTAEDVIDEMKDQMSATSLNGLIFADEYKIVAEKNETIKVNSWDMCKTTGKIKLSCEYPLDYESVKFVAYSVIKDGYPVYFAVVENPAGDSPIDLSAMADKIAKTFREYSED